MTVEKLELILDLQFHVLLVNAHFGFVERIVPFVDTVQMSLKDSLLLFEIVTDILPAFAQISNFFHKLNETVVLHDLKVHLAFLESGVFLPCASLATELIQGHFCQPFAKYL
jgi:hypothetical protein